MLGKYVIAKLKCFLMMYFNHCHLSMLYRHVNKNLLKGKAHEVLSRQYDSRRGIYGPIQ